MSSKQRCERVRKAIDFSIKTSYFRIKSTQYVERFLWNINLDSLKGVCILFLNFMLDFRTEYVLISFMCCKDKNKSNELEKKVESDRNTFNSG